jgi:hypothetical protein
LPTAVVPPDDYGKNAPPTGPLLQRKPLMALSHLVYFRLTSTILFLQALKPPLTQTVVMTTCSPHTMDPARWSQPYETMMSYAPCLHGFTMTLL